MTFNQLIADLKARTPRNLTIEDIVAEADALGIAIDRRAAMDGYDAVYDEMHSHWEAMTDELLRRGLTLDDLAYLVHCPEG